MFKAGWGLMAVLLTGGPVAAQPLTLVAAESVYGGVARELAGPRWTVTSILTNPDQDPHVFEASPSVARALSSATIVVSNGVGYDAWMAALLRASPRAARQAIDIGKLLHRDMQANPHLWYDPACMPAYASALAASLAAADPQHRAEYGTKLASFLAGLRPLQDRIAALAKRFGGTAVTATEPVFGLMAAALGLQMRNERLQLAVMNGTEPAASDVAAMEADLTGHRVRALIYNSQAASGPAARLLRVATQAGVPVVGVTETEPPGLGYTVWMMSQLDDLEKALSPRP